MINSTVSRCGAGPPAVRNALIAYGAVTAVLIAVFGVIQPSDWRGNANLHAMMEVAATLLAAFVGIVALVRFYSKKNNLYLFVGVGFLGTALLDGYHAVVTSDLLTYVMPSPRHSLSPWSWSASRTFLAMLMFFSWLAWRREQRSGDEGRFNEKVVYAMVAGLTFASFCFFVFVPLPPAYVSEFLFGRPQEFVAAVFFLLAFAGYLTKNEWKTDAFEFWLVMSLLVGFITQAVVMSRSSVMFDANFDLAHLLKIVSYALVLTGLLVNMYRLYSQVADERFRTTVESAPVAMVMIDRAGVIVMVNSRLEQDFGYPREELIGKQIEMLVPQRFRRNHPNLRSGYFANPRALSIGEGRELFGRRKDGSEFAIELGLSPVNIGQRAFVLGAVADISQRKAAEDGLRASQARLAQRAEQLAASNHELEQFAYVASHDLQEPLRKVSAFCQLLKDKHGPSLDEDANTFIDYAVDGATRMKCLVADLLSFSRVSSQGKQPAPTSSADAFAEAISNLEMAIEETQAMVTCDDLPMVIADERQLVQLLQNLIGNGLKYRDVSRQPKIHVGAAPREDHWVFSVRDNGIGIGSEYFAKIFQIFKRLHGRGEYSGTGIGLAICKKIVDRLGGKIWVESEVDVGSTFYFTMEPSPITNDEPLRNETQEEQVLAV